jgi:cation-transporting ATPase 13A1
MSTVSVMSAAEGSSASKKKNVSVVSVKGAPETLKKMYAKVPDNYDETYKYFTRRGSRVLALGQKEMPAMSANEVSPRSFLGFFCSFSFGEVLFG